LDVDILDQVDAGAIDIDFSDTYLPHVQPEMRDTILLSAMVMDNHCLEMPGSYMGVSTLDKDLLLENAANWDLGHQQHTTESPSPPFPDQSMGSACNSLSIVHDSLAESVAPRSLAQLPQPGRRHQSRPLKLIASRSSPNAMIGSKPQGIQKSACRRGPLRPEQRLGASQVREKGACVHCRKAKIRVS
jgi:hypothetical protein